MSSALALAERPIVEACGCVPIIDVNPHCWNCQRPLGISFARPWDLYCPRCKARCESSTLAQLASVPCPACHDPAGVERLAPERGTGPLLCVRCEAPLSTVVLNAIRRIITEGNLAERVCRDGRHLVGRLGIS